MIVDMSAKAITERLRLVSQLTVVCLARGKARRVMVESSVPLSAPGPRRYGRPSKRLPAAGPAGTARPTGSAIDATCEYQRLTTDRDGPHRPSNGRKIIVRA